ncbi:MAG: class I SAM-dependent methyltransferase [Gaiella sp.]|nr:class I SAM-dependent methyltransferase [Gaiella sp.]
MTAPDEVSRVKERYARRRASHVAEAQARYFHFDYFADAERDLRFAEFVRRRFDDLGPRRVLEIGAGSGRNLLLFRKLGVRWENLYANELLEEREDELRYNLPGGHVLLGDASALAVSTRFDIIVQSTVFTSILDDEFKQKLARKLLSLLTEDGVILWYDFKFDNPSNPDVKGIGRRELRRLFADAASIDIRSATLAPPIGRRVGAWYGVLNTFAPFLRTHLVAEVSSVTN